MKTLLALLSMFSISQSATLNVRAGQYLGVDGLNFVYGADRVRGGEISVQSDFSLQVYLSGTNTAWIYYGSDFGNNAWDGHGDL